MKQKRLDECDKPMVPGRGGFALALMIALCATVIWKPAHTGGGSSLLILNSDKSVKKYLTTQESFEEVASCPTDEIDLGVEGVDNLSLGRLIEQKKPKAIYCIGSKAYLTAQALAGETNIILSSAINWQRFSVGKTTYVISNELSTETQLTMFRYFFPEIKKVGVLYSKEYNNEWVEIAERNGRDFGIEVVGSAVKGPRDNKGVLNELLPQVDGLWLIPDPVVLANVKSVKRVFAIADKLRKPVFAYDPVFADNGAAIIMSPDIPTVGRQAAGLAENLLSDEPIAQRILNPVGSEIMVNMKSIEKYGLKLNEEALDSVNTIIE